MVSEKKYLNYAKGTIYWIFDLDNTIYDSSTNLFMQVEKKIGFYVSDFLKIDIKAAKKIQKKFFLEHKSTLRGLMNEYEVDPNHFLNYVHDIDYSILLKNDKLNSLLQQLPGKKFIYTNGSKSHATNVLDALGVSENFSGIFDIKDADFEPKPDKKSMQTFLKKFSIQPNKAIMLEDMAINLKTAKQFGVKTIWIKTKYSWSEGNDVDYIDFVTKNIENWLSKFIKECN